MLCLHEDFWGLIFKASGLVSALPEVVRCALSAPVSILSTFISRLGDTTLSCFALRCQLLTFSLAWDFDNSGSLESRCKITSLSAVESSQTNMHFCKGHTETTICFVLRWWTVWSEFETLHISWNLKSTLIHFSLLHSLSVWAATDTSEEQKLESRFASETGSPTVTTAISNWSVSVGLCKTDWPWLIHPR